MNPESQHDNRALDQLLATWQPEPQVTAGFEQRLEHRVRRARHLRVVRQRVAAVLCALVLVATGAWLVLNGTGSGSGSGSQASVQVANSDPMVQDLKAMSLEGDLLQHMDFLSAQTAHNQPQ